MRFSLSLFLMLLAAPAIAAEIPIHVQYVKSGLETAEQAEVLGREEVESDNPCVSKMRRELGQFAASPEMTGAVNSVIKPGDKLERFEPHLVLRYLNESMEMRFEVRKPAVKEEGRIVSKEQVLARKGVLLTARAGTWKERMDNGHCTVTEKNFNALLDAIKEAERLKACVARKVELLAATQKVSRYINEYMPVNWIEEARRKLAEQRYDITGILRRDQTVYSAGNDTFRECDKGLKLLEEEAAASVRVLNEVKAAKRGTDMPVQALEALERKLTNSAQ